MSVPLSVHLYRIHIVEGEEVEEEVGRISDPYVVITNSSNRQKGNKLRSLREKLLNRVNIVL